MSPNAHLPMPSITLLATTAPAIFLLFTGLFFGNLPVTVSLLPTMVLTRTSCLGQTIPIGGCKLLSEGSGPELDTDLCQFLSMNCALVTHHFAHTFSAQLANSLNQTVFLFIFSCIASISCITSFSSLHLTLEYLPGPIGVREKRRKLTSLKFHHFARRCSQTVPRAPGSYSLGFTPSCRPTAGGPAPHTLFKCRFPPGSVCGVGRKRAREALSFLCLTLLFSLLRFPQTILTQEPISEEGLFCPFRSDNWELVSCLCRTHDQNQKFSPSQVCARDLGRVQWIPNCQLQSVGSTVSLLPTFCYYFTDTSLCSIHSPLPMLSGVATMDLLNPFSASNFANLTCKGSLPFTAGLSASICLSFSFDFVCKSSLRGYSPSNLQLESYRGSSLPSIFAIELRHSLL